MNAKFVKDTQGQTIKICKAISLVSALATIYILLLLSPILFGQCVFAVKQTDCTGYPVNSLAYYTYMPAEDYFPGDCAAIQTERGLLLLTLTENDPEARVWHTEGDFKVYAEVPYEYLEGKVGAFCLPHMGFVALSACSVAYICRGRGAFLCILARSAEKTISAKVRQKAGEEAENGADT